AEPATSRPYAFRGCAERLPTLYGDPDTPMTISPPSNPCDFGPEVPSAVPRVSLFPAAGVALKRESDGTTLVSAPSRKYIYTETTRLLLHRGAPPIKITRSGVLIISTRNAVGAGNRWLQGLQRQIIIKSTGSV